MENSTIVAPRSLRRLVLDGGTGRLAGSTGMAEGWSLTASMVTAPHGVGKPQHPVLDG